MTRAWNDWLSRATSWPPCTPPSGSGACAAIPTQEGNAPHLQIQPLTCAAQARGNASHCTRSAQHK